MHTREVTPWLRTSRSTPFRPFADSGQHGRGDTVRAERREGGRWVALPEDTDLALGLAGGTRAVVGTRLYREAGPPVPLPCGGELRSTPDGAELVCIESFGRFSSGGPPQTARIARFDPDGLQLGHREVPLPVRVPEGEPPIGREVSTSFLGFLPEGLVFSVLETAPRESFGVGAPKHCRAFLLRPSGEWSELGSMTITADELWKLRFPRPWNEALGWHIAEGGRLRDSRGEPNP